MSGNGFIVAQLDRTDFRALAHPWRRNVPVEMSARCEPSTAEPGQPTDFTLCLEARTALPKGAHVLVRFPFASAEHTFSLGSDIAERSELRPRILLFTPESVTAEVRVADSCRGKIVELAFDEHELAAGDALHLTFEAVALPAIPGPHQIDVFVGLPGQKIVLVRCMPAIQPLDADVESLQVYLSPSLADNSARFTVAAEQAQDHGHLPAPSYEGTVQIRLPGKTMQYSFTPDDHGRKRFTVGPVDMSSRFRVEVEDKVQELSARSNPVGNDLSPDDYNLYFGDLHLHSLESDGFVDQDSVLRNARDWSNLDFVAVQEHIENSLCFLSAWCPEKWHAIRDRFDHFNESGRFVTIAGFEFRSYCNLWCVSDEYCSDWTPGLSLRSETGNDAREAMIAEWSRRDGWLVGYHRLETLFDALGHVPVPVHLLQMSHCNRPPETGSEMFLERGDRVGFFGATDSHWGLPAMPRPGQPREGQAGITGVFAKELTRDGIFEALRARRCYATMGSRSLASFTVNDQFMGAECQLEPGKNRELCIRIAGNERIKSVDIVRNGKTIETIPVGQEEAKIEWTDVDDLQGDVFYFSRTHLDDGRMIWTSPVFVSIS